MFCICVSMQAVEYYGAYYDNYKPTKAKFVGNVGWPLFCK